MKNPKLLLVDDNRDSHNWGCRATSIALNQLLSKHFLINDIIEKKTADAPHLISKILKIDPRLSIYLRLLEKKMGTKIFSKLLLIKSDFIEHNPNNSLMNFLSHYKKYPLLKDIYKKVKSSDVVVINGEGSMIFTTPPRRDLLFQLFIIELSNYLKKPVFYVNAIVSECPTYGINDTTVVYAKSTLSKCKSIAVRDIQSHQLAKELFPDINVEYYPDALFTWFKLIDEDCNILEQSDFIIGHPEKEFGKWDFSRPYICIGGSSLAAHYKKEAIKHYKILVNTLKKTNTNIYLVQTCNGDSFLNDVSELTGVKIIPLTTPILSGGYILSNAKLFVSGRYHPSILASLGGTPCIFLGSNSHKTKSLQTTLQYNNVEEFSALPDEKECDVIFEKAKKILNNEKDMRNNILKAVEKRSNESRNILDLIISIK
jgi:polysaccharide pyruvyl transferase WcaK-like protein